MIWTELNAFEYQWFQYGVALGYLLGLASELLGAVKRRNRVWYSIDGSKHKGY